MTELKIKFYADPGHGWGAVKRKVIDDLGIAGKISGYSYQRGKTVYLEEDCDLFEVIYALKERGVAVKLEEKYTDRASPIRGYDRFR